MSLKSWGFELWDQVDRLFAFTNQGLEQMELFFKTLSDIQKINISLAKKYKAIGVPPSTKTKLVLESSTYVSSLNKVFQSLLDQSNVYEIQAEDIKNAALIPIKTFLDSSKVTISDQIKEHTKFKQKLEKIKANLDAAWGKYYGAYVQKKRADAAYNKVKDDKTLPRVEIEKYQSTANQKDNELEKIKGDYAQCLQTFNKERCNLYFKDIPKICSELEILDRERSEKTLEVGQALVKLQQQHLDKSGVCNAALGEAIVMIDFKADSRSLVDNYKNTLLLPADIIFVDLVKCLGDSFNPNSFIGLSQQGGKIEKNDQAKSLFAGPGLKGIEMKDMTNEQVKTRLDDIQAVIAVVEKELAGLKTLFETYKKDPNMGDKSKLEPQIDINERKLISLREMHEGVIKNYQPKSGETSSVSANVPSKKNAVSVSQNSEDEGSFDEDEEEDFDSHDAVSEQEKMAKVIYRFEATDSQQLTVDGDQKVRVVNYDDGGTGWTLVQQLDNPANKGYVPTNYIQLL